MQHKYCFYGYRIVMVNGGWEQCLYSFMSWCVLYWTQLELGESQKMMEDRHIPVPQPLRGRSLHALLSQDWSSVLRPCHDKWAITMTTEENAFARGWDVVKRSGKVCEWTLIFNNYLSVSSQPFNGHPPANHKAEFSTDWNQCLWLKEGAAAPRGGLHPFFPLTFLFPLFCLHCPCLSS